MLAIVRCLILILTKTVFVAGPILSGFAEVDFEAKLTALLKSGILSDLGTSLSVTKVLCGLRDITLFIRPPSATTIEMRSMKGSGALLALESLLTLARENGDRDTTSLPTEWKSKLKDLQARAIGETERFDLNSLILAIDQV